MSAAPSSTERPALKDELLGLPQARQIAQAAAAAGVGIQAERFLADACEGWEALSIMARLHRLGAVLCAQMPAGFEAMRAAAVALGPQMPNSFAAMALCACVTQRQHPDDNATLDALAELTRFGSAEFAIRPLLARDPERVLHKARQWARSPDPHQRRLASEGTRPRLPWGLRLDVLARQPEGQRPILAALNADPSDYVRRSVANHLNDISKVDPAWVLTLLEGWPNHQPATQAITRHALRNLIKAGERRALALVGAGDPAQLQVEGFWVEPEAIRLGESVQLWVELVSGAPQPQQLVVDYAVHFVKKNGSTSRKVFKLRSFTLAPGECVRLGQRHAVADFTTRTHYPGSHTVELLVNGQTLAQDAFTLLA